MKHSILLRLLMLGLALTLTGAGCKSKPPNTVDIPGPANKVGGTPPANRINPRVEGSNTATPPKTGEGNDTTSMALPIGDGGDLNNPANQDRDKFAEQTVYFDLDKSTIKKTEQPKLDVVAGFFKSNPARVLVIEGHCDERGTEGYNLALGDRRALALREYLINSGVNASSIHTLSLGEQKPAMQGHTEAAWSKNRRGVFILIIDSKK